MIIVIQYAQSSKRFRYKNFDEKKLVVTDNYYANEC